MSRAGVVWYAGPASGLWRARFGKRLWLFVDVFARGTGREENEYRPTVDGPDVPTVAVGPMYPTLAGAQEAAVHFAESRRWDA